MSVIHETFQYNQDNNTMSAKNRIIVMLLLFMLLMVLKNVKSNKVDGVVKLKDDIRNASIWNELDKINETEPSTTTQRVQEIVVYQLINAPTICPDGKVLDSNDNCVDEFY